MGMRHILLIIAMVAVVMGQSVLAADKKPLTKEESAKFIEAAIRKAAGKPTGELTKADLEKVKVLYLRNNQLAELSKGLEKLTQLTELDLRNNPALTKAQIAELAHVRLLIDHNAKK